MLRSSAVILLMVEAFMAGCSGSSGDRQPAADGAGPALESKPGMDAVVDNRSRIVATVVEAVPLEPPRYRLQLRIEKVEAIAGYASFAEVDDEIDTYPNYLRREGQTMDYGSAENQQMLQAGGLQPYDRITAVIYYRGAGKDKTSLLMSWNHE